jgi:V-type H+-transporting ATPase subunit a
MLITMFLQPGSVPAQSQMYRGQGTIQLVLIMVAAVCVPWLLISKPYLLWKEMHRTQGDGYLSLGHDDSGANDIPQTPGARLEEEGRALIQTDEEEAVCFIHVVYSVCPLIDLITGASRF